MNKILSLLAPGQRKTSVSIIAIVVGIIIELTRGSLPDGIRDLLIAVVAIFTGGNVIEHITARKTQIEPAIEPENDSIEAVEEDSPDEDSGRQALELAKQVDMAAGTKLRELEGRLEAASAKLDQQTGQIKQLVDIVNKVVGVQNGQAQPPR